MMLQQSFVSSSRASCQPSGHYQLSDNRQRTRRTLEMRIIPCSTVQMSQLAPKKVSAEQWGAYWGINKMERLQKVLESLLVAYGGAWMAWFLSMLAGNVVSSFTGTALIFNWMYSPWLNAKKRNSKVWRSGNQKLNYALYIGRIVSLKRVKRRAGKTIGAVSQEFLVMTVVDERQRELEIVTQWQEPYSKLRLQMKCENMIASSKKDFSILNMVTDSWIPACGVWVGDYPYLDRTAFRDFVATVEPMNFKSGEIKRNPDSDSGFPGKNERSKPLRYQSTNSDGNDTDNRKHNGDIDENNDGLSLTTNVASTDSEYYKDSPMRKRSDSKAFEDDESDTYYRNDVEIYLDWEMNADEQSAFAVIDAMDNENVNNNEKQMRSERRKVPMNDDDYDILSRNRNNISNNSRNAKYTEKKSSTLSEDRKKNSKKWS